MSTFTLSHPSHCKQNNLFCLDRRICTIAENNSKKSENLKNLKSNLSKYHYPDLLTKQGFQETLSIPQKDLRKQYLIQITLTFIALLNSRLIVLKIITLAAS